MFIRTLGAVCGYAAALIQAGAYGWYMLDLVEGSVHTNPVSWYLWLGETLVGLLIYADRTNDRSKWIAEAVAFVGVIAVAGYLTYQWWASGATELFGTVKVPDDLWSTGLAVLAFVVWVDKREHWGPGVANWVFQFALLAAAYPLIRAAWADPSAEPFWPWALWSASFFLQFLCACLRWDGVTPLLNPLNYLATHAAVAAIAYLG